MSAAPKFTPGPWIVQRSMMRQVYRWFVYRSEDTQGRSSGWDYLVDERGNPRQFHSEDSARAALAKVDA